MFVGEGYDKKIKGLQTERQIFEDRKTKKQIYNTYFERQKDKKNKIRNRILEDRKMNVRGQKDRKDRFYLLSGHALIFIIA